MEQTIETGECSNDKCRNNRVRIQPIKEFYDAKGELKKRCQTCRNYDRDHRKNPNSDARKTAKQKYQSTSGDKEIKKEINKRYLENHPEMIEVNKERALKYYHENSEEINAHKREMTAAKPYIELAQQIKKINID